ncbi:MAG: type II secretion system F family protein [Thaumarchaeota archaeon]|nr:type II secretion system F family protein [Nitrososphaerota archaeon]
MEGAKMITGSAGNAMLRFGVIGRMHRYLTGRYARDIPAAGIAASPRQKAAESVGAALLGVVPAACISAVLYAATGMPYAFLFLAAPPALLFMKSMGLRDMARKRAAGADAELFFFAIYCDIMEKTGRGLHGAFEALGGGGSMFPAMYRESLIIRREMRVFSRSFADVLHDLGTAHPSAIFRDFLRGYAVSQTTGGVGTSAYLHERLREYHTAAKQRMDAYASMAEMLATIGSFGLAMFPIFVVVGGIMMDQYTLLFLCGFGILAVPAITTVMVARAAAASPVPAGRIPVRRAPVAAAGAAGVACLVLGMSSSWWEIAAVPLAAWCVTNHCMARGRLAGMSNLERSVPSFVRDINQKMRSNPSFFAAFTSAEAMAPYTTQFNDILRNVRSRVLLGVEISRALREARTGSWLADCVMTLMAQAARSGSVTPAVLDRLALFASHHIETKREMSAKTATPLMTGYMGSVIVVMMIIMIPVMSFDQFAALDVLAGTATGAAAAAPDAPYLGYDAGGLLAELNLVLVVVGAFCSMVLVSQIRYATILHSLHTGVLLAVIAGMLYYDRLAGAAGVPLPLPF